MNQTDSNFIIRPAENSDLEQIMQIEQSSFDTCTQESAATISKRIATFSAGFLVIVTKENQIAGYICSELWEFSAQLCMDKFVLNHPVENTHCPKGNELYISSLAILPQYRKSGWGKILFTTLIQQISIRHQLTSIILLVNKRWSNAIKLYFQQGFNECGLLPDFFKNWIPDSNSISFSDGIIMRKALV